MQQTPSKQPQPIGLRAFLASIEAGEPADGPNGKGTTQTYTATLKVSLAAVDLPAFTALLDSAGVLDLRAVARAPTTIIPGA